MSFNFSTQTEQTSPTGSLALLRGGGNMQGMGLGRGGAEVHRHQWSTMESMVTLWKAGRAHTLQSCSLPFLPLVLTGKIWTWYLPKSLSSLVLGQANYIYSLASAPAFLLASLLQADLAQLWGGVAPIWRRDKEQGVWFNYVIDHMAAS